MSAVLKLSERTRVKATIKRASAAARRDMNELDAAALDQLERIYREAAADLQAAIRGYAGTDGSVRLEVLQDLLFQVNGRLEALGQARDERLSDYLRQATAIGVRPFESVPTLSASLTQISDEALRFVRSFEAEDGLQLSDRLWRLDAGARRIVGNAIQTHVIQGHSASQAARDFIERGLTVPDDVRAQLGMSQADRLARVAADALLRGEGNPYELARRVFRTEINRAHGEAYRAAAFEHPDVIGTRFLLSPAHPEPDICDMHASVNLYGLGRGVYPKGKSPWPAHPNTISYEEVVFADEVTDEDRAGKETRGEWLQKQSAAQQRAVLGGEKKRIAFAAGLLKDNQIATPWATLKRYYERKGIDVDDLVAPTPPAGTVPIEPPEIPAAGDVRQAIMQARHYVLAEGQRTGHEHAVAVDLATGREIFRKTSRQPAAVFFDPAEVAVFTNPRARVELVHNHPRSTSLSAADLRLGTLPGVERVVAVAHEGTVYAARSFGTPEAISRLADRIGTELDERIWPMIRSGKLDEARAWSLRQHVTNVVLDRLELIEYEVQNISGTLRRVLGDLGRPEVERLTAAVLRAVEEG